jgi:hypothetical protein
MTGNHGPAADNEANVHRRRGSGSSFVDVEVATAPGAGTGAGVGGEEATAPSAATISAASDNHSHGQRMAHRRESAGGKRHHSRASTHMQDGHSHHQSQSHSGQGRQSQGWFPAPQPSISLDWLGGSMPLVSGGFALASFMYMVGTSFGTNAVLAAVAFCAFLGSTMLFLASAHRLTAEFLREHAGYNIPLGYRNFAWHRSVIAALLLFYLGCASFVASAVWNLVESRRQAAGWTLAVLGSAAVLCVAGMHLWMVFHPLGKDTDRVYSRTASYGFTRGPNGLPHVVLPAPAPAPVPVAVPVPVPVGLSAEETAAILRKFEPMPAASPAERNGRHITIDDSSATHV